MNIILIATTLKYVVFYWQLPGGAFAKAFLRHFSRNQQAALLINEFDLAPIDTEPVNNLKAK